MRIYLALILFFVLTIGYTQNYKFGKVSIEELNEAFDTQDSSANATILYKNQDVYIDYARQNGYRKVKTFHFRIKIYNKEGFKWATKKIRLHQESNTSGNEYVESLKAVTFNLDDDRITKTKLDKDGIFEEESSDYSKTVSFTMPNIREGSVIEYSYKILSPYIGINDIYFQHEIPVRKFDLRVVTPVYYSYSKLLNPKANYFPKFHDVVRNQTDTMDDYDFKENVMTSLCSNIPALKEEPFIDNIHNFRSKLSYELISVNSKSGTIRSFARTWEEVINTINKSSRFGEQLTKIGFLDEDVKLIRSSSTNRNDLLDNVFELVKNKIKWNGYYGKYTSKGLRKAYKDGLGNVADINLTLVAFLNKCGLKAYPVLVSTKRNGIPLIPTLSGFNYVVALVEMDGTKVLLDATERKISLNVLPDRAINWKGIMIKDEGDYEEVDLYPKKRSRRDILLDVVLDADGLIKGQLKSRYSNLAAFKYRKGYEKIGDSEHLKSLVKEHNMSDVYNLTIENLEKLNKPIIESIEFETLEGIDVIGDNIYLSPMFFLEETENPFKDETRNYPIDFVYPYQIQKMITVKIPEGYEISTLPEPIKMSLPNNYGSFLFNINKVQGGINIINDFKINTSIVPASDYLGIKEFFNQRIIKESEKIILTKK